MSFWQSVTWDTARASGMVAYILISASVAVGLALTRQMQNAQWPRVLNAEMHNFLALVGLVFIGIHALAVLVDPFTHFGLVAVLIPFISNYRPLWMGLGITSLYLGFAILISTWLRPRIGYAWWRRIHVLTLLGYIGVTLHGIGSGTDTRTWWAGLIYVVSVAGIGGLLILRLLKPAKAPMPIHRVSAALVGVGIVALVVWVAAGPAQAKWGTVANGGTNRTATIQGRTNAATVTDPFARGFTDTITGTIAQSTPDSAGKLTVTIPLRLSQIGNGRAEIDLQAQQTDGGLSISSGKVTLSTSAQPQLYAGSVTSISGDDTWHIDAQVTHGGTILQLTLLLKFGGNETVSGAISGAITN